MANSGHRPKYIKNVIIAGIEKYTAKYKRSILPSSHEEYKPLHQGTNYNTHGRWKTKILEPANWYKDKDVEAKMKDGKKKSSRGLEKRRLQHQQYYLCHPLEEKE